MIYYISFHHEFSIKKNIIVQNIKFYRHNKKMSLKKITYYKPKIQNKV